MNKYSPNILALVTVVSVLVGVPILDAAGVGPWTYSAKLTGSKEVPPVSTSASGLADFRITDNNTVLRYRVNLSGIANVTGGHIHLGNKSRNGDIVLDLFQIGFSKHKKTAYGMIIRGNITNHTLKGPLKGKELTDLVSAINIGDAYININSRIHSDGEIRGQIYPTSIPKYNTSGVFPK